MHLDAYIAKVHDQLSATAALGDDRTREVATALATTAAPAVRLAILDAVSAAADETTAALLDHPGSPTVTARTVGNDGGEIRIEVRAGAVEAAPAEPRRDDGDASARISLRLSDALKAEIDAAAERDGASVNAWLIRAASAALGAGDADRERGRTRGAGRHDSHRVTGWING